MPQLVVPTTSLSEAHSEISVPHSSRCSINELFPPEILSEIFLLAHASHPPRSIARNPLHHLAQPLVLRSVCKDWKALAESTRALWTQFELAPKSRPSWAWTCFNARPYLVQKAVGMMTRWLQFACPDQSSTPENTYRYPGLRFEFFSEPSEGALTDPSVDEEILKVLRRVSPHWQYVVLRMPLQMSRHLYPVRGQVGRLETLALECPDSHRSLPLTFVSAFEIAPRLKRVSINGFYENALQMPFEQLKRISVNDRNCYDSYHVLRRSASSVVTATISPCTISQPSLPPLPVVELPKLAHLQYIDHHLKASGTWGAEIFRYLVAPNLRTLILHDFLDRSSYNEVFKMIQRSKANQIRHLELRGLGGNSLPDTLNLLESTSESLEYLLVAGVLDLALPSFSSLRSNKELESLTVTVGVVVSLVEKIEQSVGYRNLRELVLRMKVKGLVMNTAFSCLRSLCQVVLIRSLELGGPEEKRVPLKLRLRISESSDEVLDSMRDEWDRIRRKCENKSDGVHRGLVVIEKA
ncbi:hypothetical protein L218DRAFT_738066 [Marasmius fiardii PR-910]|nr:hypothetical protein L218DRAFT_738066 [Marasmius fiardii PR-910]